jgi:DegV family protein with EDD domain
MKIALSAESTIDLPANLLKEYDIHTTPFTILLGDEVKLDGEVTCPQIVEYVNKTGVLPKTSAVNQFQFKEHFDNLLKDYDAVIHFSLSSEISVACHNAKTCAEDYDNVYVIDSRTLSTGIALLAIYASKLVKKGLDAKTIVEMCTARIPHLQVSFVLARLDYLHKGGRCSALSCFGANLLKLRLQILVKDGKMGPSNKYRGNMDKCIVSYVNDTLQKFDNPDKSEIFITSTTASEAQIQSVKEILENHGFKHIMVTNAGGTITSHCGEDCLGILYLNDGDHE